MNDATRVIRAGLAPAAKGEEFLRGPVFAGAYHLEDDPEGSAFSYGRTNNPTWVGYENAISDLEHAAATVVFSSGIAAIAATLGVSLKPGDVVVMPSDGYYGSRVLANGFFSKFGVDVWQEFQSAYERLSREELLLRNNGTIELTRRGLLQVDHFLSEFFEPELKTVRYA